MRTLSEKSAGAGHRAVSLHRDCVLVYFDISGGAAAGQDECWVA